ncbi:MAG: efflux RND transporter periplasmic adaptor subunit [Prolixibacteraceae bacterium]
MRKEITRILVLLSLSGGILLSCSKQNAQYPSLQKGDFTQTIIETGELAAVEAKSFVLPRFGRYWYEMKIVGLLDHGTRVAAGDSIIQLDPTEIKKFIIDRENELETQKANLEKTIVQIENQKSDKHSSLLNEQAAFDLKKLELEQFRFESDKAKKIKQLEFQQAQLRLDKIKKNIELYKIISKNELTIQKIRVMRIEEEIKGAYDVLPRLTIRTPIPGIFQVAKKRRSRDLIKVGDEIYVGNNMGNVPDLTWMKANTIINEADVLKVFVGQKVNVRLDALHDVIFPGEISYISKLCRPIENNSRQKIFDIEVKISTSDERLKPGMTVSCEFICSDLENVWYAPLNCVEKVDDAHFIYLRKGGNIEKQKVDVGPSNNLNIVLKGEFKKNLELVPIQELLTPKTEE